MVWAPIAALLILFIGFTAIVLEIAANDRHHRRGRE
jgi:hypothetical protein